MNKPERIDPATRLREMAQQAIDQYNAELSGGGEPTYPAWAQDVFDVLDASRAMLPVTDSEVIEKSASAIESYGNSELAAKLRSIASPVAGWVSVEYTMGTNPTQTGVYACRIPHPIAPNLTEDKFLMWFDGRWAYPSSDQNYRGEVIGWIGPLPRKLPPAPVTPKQEQS